MFNLKPNKIIEKKAKEKAKEDVLKNYYSLSLTLWDFYKKLRISNKVGHISYHRFSDKMFWILRKYQEYLINKIYYPTKMVYTENSDEMLFDIIYQNELVKILNLYFNTFWKDLFLKDRAIYKNSNKYFQKIGSENITIKYIKFIPPFFMDLEKENEMKDNTEWEDMWHNFRYITYKTEFIDQVAITIHVDEISFLNLMRWDAKYANFSFL